MDPENFSNKSFSSKRNFCFDDVYGSKNLYSNQNYFFHHFEFKPSQDSLIDPWTITIIVCCILQFGSTYCFHTNTSCCLTQRYLYLIYWPDHPILLPNDFLETKFAAQNDSVEAVPFIYVAVKVDLPSSYQMNSNYRRPKIESDYSHSTMSPNGG